MKYDKEPQHTTRGIKNCRDSWLLGCIPLQLSYNLTGIRWQSLTGHTANT